MSNDYDKILNIIIQIIKLILFVIGGCFILGFLLNLFGDEEIINISILESISFILMLLIIGSIIIFSEKNQKKYLISGLFFSFALSITYLPVLLSIVDGSSWGEHYVDEPLVILFITLINFIYIAIIGHNRFRSWNLLLIPINIILTFIIPFLLSQFMTLKMEGNVFAFSLIFLFIPWVILMLITSGIHRYYTRQLTVNID